MNAPKQQDPTPPGNRTANLVIAVVGVVMAGVVGWLFYRAAGPKQAPAAPAQIAQPAPEMPATPPPAAEDEAALAAAPRATIAEIVEGMKRGEVAFLDVRDLDSYKAGHVPGAMQIPLEYVKGEVEYLPKDKWIVAYCT